MKLLVILLFVFASCSACFLLSSSDRPSNLDANRANADNAANSVPVPERTLITSSATSPPADLIEALRAEMRRAAPSVALERHPASKLVGESCDEISFGYYDRKGDQAQYIAIYRCPLQGAVVGVSKFDSQVTVIGEIRFENAIYSKSLVSAQATN